MPRSAMARPSARAASANARVAAGGRAAIDREALDVHSRTKVLEVGLGPRAEMRDDFGGGDRAGRRHLRKSWPRQRAARKPAANRSPAPVVSTTLLDRGRRDFDPARRPRAPSAPCGAAGDDQGRHLGGQLVERARRGRGAPVSCIASSSLANSRSIAAAVDHLREAFAAPGDADAFRQSEGDLAPGARARSRSPACIASRGSSGPHR